MSIKSFYITICKSCHDISYRDTQLLIQVVIYHHIRTQLLFMMYTVLVYHHVHDTSYRDTQLLNQVIIYHDITTQLLFMIHDIQVILHHNTSVIHDELYGIRRREIHVAICKSCHDISYRDTQLLNQVITYHDISVFHDVLYKKRCCKIRTRYVGYI